MDLSKNVNLVVIEAAKMEEAVRVRYFHGAKEVGDVSPLLKRLFVMYNTNVPTTRGRLVCCWTHFREQARKMTIILKYSLLKLIRFCSNNCKVKNN